MENDGNILKTYKVDSSGGGIRLRSANGILLYASRGNISITLPGGQKDCQVKSLFAIPPASEAIIGFSAHSECYVTEMNYDLPVTLKAAGLEPAIWRWTGFGTETPDSSSLAIPDEHELHILTLLNRMALEEERQKPGAGAMRICLFTELLVYLFRHNLRPSRNFFVKSPEQQALCVKELAGYIEKNSSDDFSLDGLAGHCGLNPSYLSRSFREQTGMPLFEFINSARVKKACQLLKNTDLPVIDVAYTVGYNNISFFNRYFRRIMDMSPVEYREYSRK